MAPVSDLVFTIKADSRPALREIRRVRRTLLPMVTGAVLALAGFALGRLT